MKRLQKPLLGLFVLTALVSGGADESVPEATPGAPEGQESVWALMETQAKLVDAADSLATSLRATAPYDTVVPDFGSIELDVPQEKVLLFWKAGTEIGSSVLTRIANIENEFGVDIVLDYSRFSMQELMAAQTALAEVMDSYPGVFRSVVSRSHASGVTIRVKESDIGWVRELPEVVLVQKSLDEAQAFPDVEETVVVQQGQSYVFTSRLADTQPYWAGAQIGVQSPCTSGFAVANSNARGILTAWHCFPNTGDAATNGVGISMGTAFVLNQNLNRAFDVARIDVPGPWYSEPRMYDGPFQNEFVRSVKGKGSNFPGMFICTSGSQSGARCNIQVDPTILPTGIFTEPFTLQRIEGVVVGVQRDGENASGTGDSGGPVFTLQVDLVHIKARGIMIAGGQANQVPCTGVGNRFCSSHVVYADIENALQKNDVWLELEP